MVADPRVFVYAAGGYYYPGKGLEGLAAEMQGYLDRGYTVVKMKIGGAPLSDDCRRIETVLRMLPAGCKLAVDANGRFDLDTAVAYAKALREYDLFWYEEAGDPLDYELQAKLAEHYPGPMATGENLFSMQDARNLIRYGGMRSDRDWLQFDCALSYGLVEYLRTLEMLKTYGWSWRRCIPHGGHQMSLNIAAGLGLGGNESYPDLFQPYGGFPDGVRVEAGHITMPELLGIGFEGKSDLIRKCGAWRHDHARQRQRQKQGGRNTTSTSPRIRASRSAHAFSPAGSPIKSWRISIPRIHQPACLAVHGDGVVGLVADRIGLVVADHEIALGAQQLQQQRRQMRVAVIERADVPGSRDAGINRRKAVQRHQHRRHGGAAALVDDLADAPVVGIEDLRAPHFRCLARNALIACYRRGLADARDRACGIGRAVAVDDQPRVALHDQMGVEVL